MFQIDLTMMRIQQNKIISLKVENEDENTVCGEHLIPLVHVNDGVERHLRKGVKERFVGKEVKKRFVEKGVKEEPERKCSLCQERPRQEGHCSRLGRWLGGMHCCSLWSCYNCKIRWVGGWGRPFARLLQMSCLSWS